MRYEMTTPCDKQTPFSLITDLKTFTPAPHKSEMLAKVGVQLQISLMHNNIQTH